MQGTLPRQKIDLWQAVKDLDFLSAFFSWFFMLLTRLSEPLMLLSTLYVVAETGVPAIATPALHNLAIGIMITAPEIILPGAFVVASRSKQHAGWLYTVCWTFVVLTLLTLVSLFVWHFTGQSLAWLMCARCATAVGYSILMRVMNHRRDQVQTISVPDVLAHLSVLSLQVKSMQEMPSVQPAMLDTIRADISARMNGLEQSVGQKIATLSVPKPVPIPVQIAPSLEQFGSFEMQGIVAQIPGDIEHNSAWEFIEYGHARIPDEMAREADGQSEISPQFAPQFAPTLTELSPQNQPAKSHYLMSYEEAAKYTGLSVRRLQSKVNAGEIERSTSGKLKVKSLEKFRQKSA